MHDDANQADTLGLGVLEVVEDRSDEQLQYQAWDNFQSGNVLATSSASLGSHHHHHCCYETQFLLLLAIQNELRGNGHEIVWDVNRREMCQYNRQGSMTSTLIQFSLTFEFYERKKATLANRLHKHRAHSFSFAWVFAYIIGEMALTHGKSQQTKHICQNKSPNQ